MVLVDSGLRLNVCHLKVSIFLGLGPKGFTTTEQTVKAYDNFKRKVIGIVTIDH